MSAPPSNTETLVYDAREIGFNRPDPLVHRAGCPDAPRSHIVRVHGLAQTPAELATYALRSCPRCRIVGNGKP